MLWIFPMRRLTILFLNINFTFVILSSDKATYLYFRLDLEHFYWSTSILDRRDKVYHVQLRDSYDLSTIRSLDYKTLYLYQFPIVQNICFTPLVVKYY